MALNTGSATQRMTLNRASSGSRSLGASSQRMAFLNPAFSNAGAQSACKALKAEGFQCVTFSTATASAN